MKVLITLFIIATSVYIASAGDFFRLVPTPKYIEPKQPYIAPFFKDVKFQEEIVKNNIDGYIDKCQALTLLPQKETITLKEFKLIETSGLKNGHEYDVIFSITLTDEEKTIYSGRMEVVYNTNDNKSGLEYSDITNWNAVNSTNTKLSSSVTIDTPFIGRWYQGKNITKEVYEGIDVEKYVEQTKKQSEIEKLSKTYKDLEISHSKVASLGFGYEYDSYSHQTTDRIKGLKKTIRVESTLTGTYKKEKHSYKIKWAIYISAENSRVLVFDVVPENDNQSCTLLIDAAAEKVIENLQKENLLPLETLTTSNGGSCKWLSRPSYREWNAIELYAALNFTLENDATKVKYQVEANADILSNTTKQFYHLSNIVKFTWDTRSAVHKNKYFPTEYFTPKTCNSDDAKDQKTLPLNDELPVKFFTYLIESQPITSPQDLVNKNYTLSEIKVLSIENNCTLELIRFKFFAIYRFEGILTTSEGHKYKALLTGELIPSDYERVRVADPPRERSMWQKLRGAKPETTYHYETRSVTNKMVIKSREFIRL